jgi:hypothetical protein
VIVFKKKNCGGLNEAFAAVNVVIMYVSLYQHPGGGGVGVLVGGEKRDMEGNKYQQIRKQ